MSKPKKCKVCKTPYEPFTSLQAWCSPACGYELSKRNLEKKAKSEAKIMRKDTKKRKDALKSKSDHLDEAQKACNAYIRKRDEGKGCISCGTQNPNIQYCAGHYKTRGGYPELRFHPMNIHLQCNQHCNLQNSGNIGKYRPELIKRIGISQVEWLEGGHEAQNLTISDIQEIKAYYREQIKLI